MTKRGLRLFYSEDEGDSSDDGNKMALATVLIFSFFFIKKYTYKFSLQLVPILL